MPNLASSALGCHCLRQILLGLHQSAGCQGRVNTHIRKRESKRFTVCRVCDRRGALVWARWAGRKTRVQAGQESGLAGQGDRLVSRQDKRLGSLGREKDSCPGRTRDRLRFSRVQQGRETDYGLVHPGRQKLTDSTCSAACSTLNSMRSIISPWPVSEDVLKDTPQNQDNKTSTVA